MISSEELNEAIHNIKKDLNDLESAKTIMEAVTINNYFIIADRVNIVKVAMKCILEYLNNPRNLNITESRKENVKLRVELEQEKEKNKELEKQINFNKKTVEIAQTQILEYSQGYKDGLNKETTATAIVARELELNFIRQEIKHKYISKDKIREKIRMYKLVGNSVSARTLELLLEEN